MESLVTRVFALSTLRGPLTYQSRYLLKVVEYDEVDKNEDGINEPGEHMIIKNLVVLSCGNCFFSLTPLRRSLTNL